jgi:hypothetical protein
MFKKLIVLLAFVCLILAQNLQSSSDHLVGGYEHIDFEGINSQE